MNDKLTNWVLFITAMVFSLTVAARISYSQEIKTFNYSYGGKYEGEAKESLRDGQGTMVWANGDKYTGGWKDDQANGRGKYVWSNGDAYEGEWKDNKMHGEGAFVFADGQKYVGELQEDKFSGQGTMTWSDGSKYVGEWKNDGRNGSGTMIWSDGSKYEGGWANDERSGDGTLSFSNGEKYEGQFENDEMNGVGTYTYAGGKTYTGEFRDGKFNDPGERLASAPQEFVLDRVAAVVNEDVITLYEVKETALSVNKNPDDPEAQSQVLELMIEEELLGQEAKKRGITVAEQEIDASIEEVKKRFNMTDEQMKEVLKQQNLTPESFREQWKRQLLSNKLFGEQVQGKIAVTEDEIKDHYEQNYGKIQSVEEVKVSHVLIPVESFEEEARNLAEEVAELARSGEDFGELAGKYSKDELSAGRGGDLGFFKKGQLVKELDDAVNGAEAGEIVGPVKSPAGYHVMIVTDRKTAESDQIGDSFRAEAREELYQKKVEKAIQAWLEGVKETAYIERKL